MVTNPDDFIEAFCEAGTTALMVHQEGGVNLHRTVQRIKEHGKQVGVAINPATPAESLEAILPELDEVLVMTVNPGFGGQEFIPATLRKIRRLHTMIEELNPACEIAVDGGINPQTAPQVVSAGARILIAGSAIFRAKSDIATAISQLRESVAPAKSNR